jgi:hypothetical protein
MQGRFTRHLVLTEEPSSVFCSQLQPWSSVLGAYECAAPWPSMTTRARVEWTLSIDSHGRLFYLRTPKSW